jgi:ABC-type lipoprotein release transport system permease subunit
MMIQTFKMAWRDLGRNRRRSFFSALALGIGLALLLLIASVLNGEMRGAMDTSINLQSGHLQVQAKTYNFDTLSLDWQDLVENPNQIAQQIAALELVKAATPRLFASGIVASGEQSAGVRIFGVDTTSDANAPYRDGVVAGSYISNDDRDGVLMGQELANKMGLKAGDTFNLLVNTANGDVDEQRFTIRGIYTTRTPPFDETTLILPMAKAQAISGAGDRASTIFVLLKDRDQTDAVVNALQSSQYQVKTWRQLNDVLVQTEELSRSYMILIYLIVLAITATVIVNTLIMAVFERTREIGILTAIGMKSRRVMAMFFTESALLAIGGIIIGLILGGILVWYFTNYGFYIGNMGLDESVMIGERIYAHLTMNDAITLSLLAFVVTLLAALYPALLAARMEPVVALRGGE